jgi:hypothetical protein
MRREMMVDNVRHKNTLLIKEIMEECGISSPRRVIKMINESISLFRLDLSGLTVLTEAANRYYNLTPIIAALSGAEKVFAITRNSRFATAEKVEKELNLLSNTVDVRDTIKLITKKTPKIISLADIITNLGFVRPIDKWMIHFMKGTAAIPLMFETWEFRKEDIDLNACQEKGIPVLGTNEEVREIDMFKYSGPLCLKQILDMDLEIIDCKFVVRGGGVFGANIIKALSALGAEVWAVCSESPEEVKKLGAKKAGNNLKEHETKMNLKDADALIVASFPDENIIVGDNGEITAEDLQALSEGISVIPFFGEIDRTSLDRVGIPYTPNRDPGKGHMALTMADLGPKQMIKLNTASLRVGEIMCRARLDGCSRREAEERAIEEGLGQDFSVEQKIELGLLERVKGDGP